MNYGTMLRRLKQEEEREERRATKLQPMPIRRATPESLRQGQTPTDIVLARSTTCHGGRSGGSPDRAAPGGG